MKRQALVGKQAFLDYMTGFSDVGRGQDSVFLTDSAGSDDGLDSLQMSLITYRIVR